MSKVGIVVPTVFSRPEHLPGALRSIRESRNAYVLIVSPGPKGSNSGFSSLSASDGLVDELFTEQPGLPLATKISDALKALPKEIEFIGWLGDDDLLEPGALDLARETLESDPDVVMVYGDCRYIDKDGNELFINRAGEKARRLLGYGPQLIPQPGALWRRDAFEAVGGLSADFDLAFDYDLFMKLKRHGKISYIPQTLASFRWHPDSLSVKQRWKSAIEASRVRIRHHRGPERLLILLEPMIILATWAAGKLVTRFRLWPNQSNQSR